MLKLQFEETVVESILEQAQLDWIEKLAFVQFQIIYQALILIEFEQQLETLELEVVQVGNGLWSSDDLEICLNQFNAVFLDKLIEKLLELSRADSLAVSWQETLLDELKRLLDGLYLGRVDIFHGLVAKNIGQEFDIHLLYIDL